MRISDGLRRTTNGYMHWCPGCKAHHTFAVDVPLKNGAQWSYNGDPNRPTFEPSMLAWYDETNDENGTVWPGKRCHYFLRDGRIQFLNDSTHSLAGQTVDLPSLPGSD